MLYVDIDPLGADTWKLEAVIELINDDESALTLTIQCMIFSQSYIFVIFVFSYIDWSVIQLLGEQNRIFCAIGLRILRWCFYLGLIATTTTILLGWRCIVIPIKNFFSFFFCREIHNRSISVIKITKFGELIPYQGVSLKIFFIRGY